MSISDSSADTDPFLPKHPCPCCHLPTLDAPAQNDICPECGWQDDGQSDVDADTVRGGPNGARSLTEARAIYANTLLQLPAPDRRDSFTEGGPGLWWTMALRHAGAAGLMSLPSFDFDAEPDLDFPNADGAG
jgi:hypothetical protein